MSIVSSLINGAGSLVTEGENALGSAASSALNAIGLGAPKSQSANLGAKQFLNNESYIAQIYCQQSKIDIRLYLEQALSFGVTAQYSQPFASALDGGGAISGLMRTLGVMPLTQFLTTEIWYGSSSIEFSLDFVIYAEENARSDVVDPIKQLMALVIPSVTKLGFLQTPGPYLGKKTNVSSTTALNAAGDAIGSLASATAGAAMSTVTNGFASGVKKELAGIKKSQATIREAFGTNNKISLVIGTFAFFSEVVITGVEVSPRVLWDSEGKPTYSQVRVGFKTYRTPVVSDIDKIFG